MQYVLITLAFMLTCGLWSCSAQNAESAEISLSLQHPKIRTIRSSESPLWQDSAARSFFFIRPAEIPFSIE